ncbi:tRNA pseudouridine synthase [Wickerhamomyces ciferrii]|uniref:tRNA pseudouridine(55) synthase n=1 Tax=Wickerhamomyces ciferrii (strain ATCC 14091 / BCRC 22168 / CBS 111 / JCM 3599 / NBRC 0793 / NRRL Y-1031 F-60-10) TaxID=1206466 RepID=K0KU39_WICCF|nr:tRNA pseudouridine synthase [Wickerhamomyces ciferrii]CCH44929.1 tRNA pseudouridine synthase [Wickerhamomyces ciferrii]
MSEESPEMNGILAISKPQGITSSKFLAELQKVFTESPVFSQHLANIRGNKMQAIVQTSGKRASKRQMRKYVKVKMGHGGTLDPLATGVLVVGIGNGTKKLQNYLQGTIKKYEAEALFGASTTSGDVEGEVLTKNQSSHITQKQIDEIPEKFIGHLKQTPPIFAALKMDGKPLYEYARQGLPLPRAIEPREVQIYDLEVMNDTLSTNHSYDFIKSTELNEGENLEDVLSKNPTLNDNKLYFSKEYTEKLGKDNESFEIDPPLPNDGSDKVEGFKAPLLHFTASVSSGTYIRSLISDIGKSVQSSAYMVKLIRLKQAEWELNKNVFKLEDFTERPHQVWGKVLKIVLEKGGEEVQDLSKLFEKAEIEYNEELKKENELKNQEDKVDENKDLNNQEKVEENFENDDNSTKKRNIDDVEQ